MTVRSQVSSRPARRRFPAFVCVNILMALFMVAVLTNGPQPTHALSDTRDDPQTMDHAEHNPVPRAKMEYHPWQQQPQQNVGSSLARKWIENLINASEHGNGRIPTYKYESSPGYAPDGPDPAEDAYVYERSPAVYRSIRNGKYESALGYAPDGPEPVEDKYGYESIPVVYRSIRQDNYKSGPDPADSEYGNERSPADDQSERSGNASSGKRSNAESRPAAVHNPPTTSTTTECPTTNAPQPTSKPTDDSIQLELMAKNELDHDLMLTSDKQRSDKRNANSGATKRRTGNWNGLRGMWGKRAGGGWNKLNGSWGKRSAVEY